MSTIRIRDFSLLHIRRSIFLASVLLLLSLPLRVHAQIEITLKNSFIDDIKNRATIDVDYLVDKAHKHPNTAAKDGDMHIAGRAPTDVGLAIVAEIMNAKFEQDAVKAIHDHESNMQPLRLEGVWRLWCEHPGRVEHVQDTPLEEFDTTNPPHVFEIHPVTSVGDRNVLDSFKPIQGFKPKKAQDAFDRYERATCKIIPNDDGTTTIVAKSVGYNYVEFTLEINGAQKVVDGGRIVKGNVVDTEDEIIAGDIRMIFVKDTAPEKKVKTLGAGKKMHLLGIPRIDLEEVSRRVKNAAKKPYMLSAELPYEIIVVGLYKN